MNHDKLWTHAATSGHDAARELIGYAVEATDGHVGKVDRHSTEVDAAHLVVDTGWLLGRQVLLPAGTVTRIDHEERTVHVGRSKEEIRSAPPLVDPLDPGYFQLLGGYYGPMI
ncbi:PRC-barrel domain containing protein [Kitasatospora sp. NBC_01560]|uniref:PRC-barrel domain containing protein n=1 Tax=Kitasatospora sp. NBC_01560 TaxID=2975965 RepID=UPI00386FEDB0